MSQAERKDVTCLSPGSQSAGEGRLCDRQEVTKHRCSPKHNDIQVLLSEGTSCKIQTQMSYYTSIVSENSLSLTGVISFFSFSCVFVVAVSVVYLFILYFACMHICAPCV